MWVCGACVRGGGFNRSHSMSPAHANGTINGGGAPGRSEARRASYLPPFLAPFLPASAAGAAFLQRTQCQVPSRWRPFSHDTREPPQAPPDPHRTHTTLGASWGGIGTGGLCWEQRQEAGHHPQPLTPCRRRASQRRAWCPLRGRIGRTRVASNHNRGSRESPEAGEGRGRHNATKRSAAPCSPHASCPGPHAASARAPSDSLFPGIVSGSKISRVPSGREGRGRGLEVDGRNPPRTAGPGYGPREGPWGLEGPCAWLGRHDWRCEGRARGHAQEGAGCVCDGRLGGGPARAPPPLPPPPPRDDERIHDPCVCVMSSTLML